MFYGEDFDGVVEVAEPDAVISDSETELWRFDITEPLNVAFAGGEHAGESVENAQGCGLFDSAEVRLGAIAPNNLLPHMLSVRAVWFRRRVAHALEVFGAEAKLGENLFVGDAFAAAQRFLGCLDLARLFLADRLIVIGRASQGAGERIQNDLQETNHCGDLAGSHAVDQLVSVLFFVGGTVGHGMSLAKSAALGIAKIKERLVSYQPSAFR
jgi:hypothetical protein